MALRAAEQAGPVAMAGDGGLLVPCGVVAVPDETELPVVYRDAAGLQPPARLPPGPPSGERQEWKSSVDYLMVLLGYAIGIGNVWRFPYLVAKNGGGAFLVPYLLCLVFVAAPLFLMEMILGQATRCSTIECYRRIHPRYVGIAVASTSMVFVICTYYNTLLAYCVLYFAGSFQSPLPWSEAAVAHRMRETIWENSTASHYYWEHVILDRFSRAELEDSGGAAGGVRWHLAGALFVVWCCVFVAVSRGIQSSSKAAWLTVPLPLVLIVVMLLRAVTLPGAGDGIAYYLSPNFEKLGDPAVWALAGGQILFSLSPGMGTAITMSSYTKRGEDVHRASLIIAAANSSFSVLSGFVIFALLGNMSHNSGTPVAALAEQSSSGLAFVVLAEGLGQFGHGANLFSALFFLMLLTLGLDSTFAWVETLNSVCDDHFESVARRGGSLAPFLPAGWRPSKTQLALATSAALYLVSLPYCTRVGFYLIDVVDHFCNNYVLFTVITLECVMVRRDFGVGRLLRHVATATGKALSPFWAVCWTFTAPVVCLSLLVALLASDLSTTYEDYPANLIAFGVFSAVLPLACIPGVPLVQFLKDRCCGTRRQC
ncbi:Sodium-dependent serotonin transporter [Diplonema papillatum]|nr:Sodium-dependent serotonin transporter [Diplonema papillatum]